MTASKPERRTVLGEDGEIRDLDSVLNEPEAATPAEYEEHESIYCTRCGAENPHDASYCARCGKPLVEPGLPADEAKRKRKRDLGPTQMPMASADLTSAAVQPRAAGEFNVWGMIARLVMLTFMAGMVITSVAVNEGRNAWIGVATLVTWFLVEAVRGGKRFRTNFASMIVEIVTLVFVAGMVITPLTVNEGKYSWLSLIVLVVWFLTEAVRS